MSDLNFEADDSGAEKALLQLASAVDTLKAALMALDRTPLERIKGELKGVTSVVDVMGSAVSATMEKVKQDLRKSGREAGGAAAAGLAEGIKQGGAQLKGQSGAIGQLLQDQAEGVKKWQAEVRRATINAAADYSTLAGKVTTGFSSKSASKMTLDETRAMLGMPDRGEMKSLAAQLKAQMVEGVSNEKVRWKAASPMTLDETRLLLGMPDRGEMKSLAAQLKAQMVEGVSSEKVRWKAASPMTLDETRLLLGMPDRGEMKSLAAQLKAQMGEGVREANAANDNLAKNARFQAQPAKSQLRTATAAQEAISSGMVEAEAIKRWGSEAVNTAKNLEPLRAKAAQVSAGVKASTALYKEAHDSVRGLAGAFNVLWLTWGSLVPIAAGAAIGAALRGVLTVGQDVERNLAFVQVLSNGAAISLRDFSDATAGAMVGPQQASEALRGLAQNGLSVRDSLATLPTVLTLATAGEMSLKEAALGLTGVMAAFNLGIGDSGRVADVFSKAAAISNTSVQSMVEAMKQASTVSDSYNVSLEETAAALATMAKRNIEGTAAGTAFRNMWVELATPTRKGQEALEKLGVTIFDSATHEMKPATDILKELHGALATLSEQSRLDVLNRVFGERGAKAAGAIFADFDKFGSTLDVLQNKADGFAKSITDALQQTLSGKVQMLTADLQTTFARVFEDSSSGLKGLVDQARLLVADPEFTQALKDLSRGVVDLTRFLVDHAGQVAATVAIWKGVQIIGPMVAAAIPAVVALGKSFTVAGVSAAGMWAAATGGLSVLVALAAQYWLTKDSVDAGTQSQIDHTNALRLANQAQETQISLLEKQIDRRKKVNALVMGGVPRDQAETQVDVSTEQSALMTLVKQLDEANKGLSDAESGYARLAQAKREYDFQKPNDRRDLPKVTPAEVEAAAGKLKAAKDSVAQLSDSLANAQRQAELSASLRAETLVETHTRLISDLNSQVTTAVDRDPSLKSKLEPLVLPMTVALEDDATFKKHLATAKTEVNKALKTLQFPVSGKGNGGERFNIIGDNTIKQLEQQLNVALEGIRSFTQTKQQLLDNARQTEAVSDGAYAAQNIALTRTTEATLLAEIEASTPKIEAAYDKRRKVLQASLAEARGLKDPDRRAGAIKEASAALSGLDNERTTSLAKLQKDRDAVTNAAYLRMGRLANEAAGAVRKLDEEERKLTLTESRLAEDRSADAQNAISLMNYGPAMAAALGAEYAEKQRLLKLDRDRTDAIAEQQRMINDFRAAQGTLDTAAFLNDSVSAKDVVAGSAEQQAALDAMIAKLERMKQLRDDLLGTSGKKVQQAGADAAMQQLAGLGQVDLAAVFDDAKVSIDGVGLSISKAANAMLGLVDARDAYTKAMTKEGKTAKDIAKIERDSISAQIKGTADLLGGTKAFFKEKTGAYKALDAAEKAYRVAELVMAAESFASKMGWITAETTAVIASEGIKSGAEAAGTASSLALTGARTQAKGVEALVAQLTLPFPANVPAFAMVAALLATLGVAAGAFGGGGGASVDPGNTGTGTVLGDKGAASESISKSLEYLDTLVNLTGVQNQYTAKMVSSLQNLTTQLGGVGDVVARNGSATTVGDGVATGFTRNVFGDVASTAVRAGLAAVTFGLSEIGGIGNALGNIVGKLFGTSVKVDGQGLYAGPQAYGSVAAGGLGVSSYADITEKKRTFGITTSTDSYTKYADAGAETKQQFTSAVLSLGDAVSSAAGVLMGSTNNAKAALANYVVNLGKLNLEGLSTDQINEKLAAVFSREGDLMAQFLLPEIVALEKAGEGALQTLTRYAGNLSSVNDALSAMGVKMFDASLAGAKMATSLVDAFGGSEKFSSSLTSYYEGFYSEAERTANTTQRLSAALGALGFAMPATRDAYRKMVDDFVNGGGLLTESGQSIYAELIALSEPFANVTKSVSDLKDTLIQTSKDIMDYVKSLATDRAGLATPLQQLQSTRSTYLADLGLARGGDADALGRLTTSANAYIEAQKSVTASSDYTQAVIDQVIAELTGVAKPNVPGYAKGGYHPGGWAMVGEQGPELAYFGNDARIYTAANTSAMLNSDELVGEVRALRQEVSGLRAQQASETQQIVTTNIAAQQQAACAVVEGISEATQRQAWVEQSKPEIK